MLWRLLEGDEITPKYVVAACPKHGLHLIDMMIQGYVRPMPRSIYGRHNWLGTFRFNSFTADWQELERWFFLASRLQQGRYYKGHIGWNNDIAEFLRLSRVAFVFIYRDLRDAAVSMAHHVTRQENVNNLHPASALYRALGGFDEVLSACITGIGPFLGVVGLWELYAPWLNEGWVYNARYEDALEDLPGVARGIVEYGLSQITRDVWEVPLRIDYDTLQATVDRMVTLALDREASPTFRKGEPGEWREAFKPQHIRQFAQVGGNEWLKRMGYEVE